MNGRTALLALRQQAVLFVIALQFLTRLPTPAVRGYRAQWLSQSARYFPLVGVVVGSITVAVWWLVSQVLPATVSVGVMLAASLLLTGAFHEDGFADACDGFGGGVSRDRVLEIMQDSRIGAYGAMGIFVMLGLKWTILAALPRAAIPLMVLSAHVVSRWCATALIWRLAYVRVQNDAKAKPFAGSLGGGAWLASGVIGALPLVGGVLIAPPLGGFALRGLAAGVAAAGATALLAAAYCRQRIGGYTGDCLGAVQQLAELSCLLVGLAVLAPAQGRIVSSPSLCCRVLVRALAAPCEPTLAGERMEIKIEDARVRP